MKELFKKFLTKEVILYIVFGVLTTLINLGTFYVLHNLLGVDENISNVIAIIMAVLVAYVTNKDLVFHSQAKTIKEKTKEFAKFIAGRAFTMVVEFVGCWLLFQTAMPELISKGIVTVIVIILNWQMRNISK